MSDRTDDRVSIPANDLLRRVRDGIRGSLGSPGPDADDGSPDAPREVDLVLDPVAMRNVHPAQDQEDVRRTHLIVEACGELLARLDRIVLGNAQVPPSEVRSLTQEPDDSVVVIAVLPGVANEHLVFAQGRHRVSPVGVGPPHTISARSNQELQKSTR